MRAHSLRMVVGALLAGATTAAGVVVAASPAAAAPRLFEQRVVTASVGVEGFHHRGVTAECGKDEVVTGGGFSVDGTTDPDAYTVFVNAPMGNGWNVQAYLDGGYRGVMLTAYAVCLRKVEGGKPLSQRVVSVESKVFGGYTSAAYPTCDPGEVATGGGYVVPSIDPAGYTVYVDEPLNNGWNVQIYSDLHPYVLFYGYVVCLKAAKSIPVHRRVVHEAGRAPGGTVTSLPASCDKREVVTGGGFSVGSINPHAYTVSHSRPSRLSWMVELYHDASPKDVLPIWSSVVCLRAVP